MPEMQNPSPANDRNVVPSNSSMTSLYPASPRYFHSSSSPRAPATSRTYASTRIARACARSSPLRDRPRVQPGREPVWVELWDCRTSGWVCRMRSPPRLRSYLVNFRPPPRSRASNDANVTSDRVESLNFVRRSSYRELGFLIRSRVRRLGLSKYQNSSRCSTISTGAVSRGNSGMDVC